MSLRHIAIPSWHAAAPPKLPTYALATRVQTALQQAQQSWKASSSISAPPAPALISFMPAPTYTLGRRQTEPLSAAELAHLQEPLRVSLSYAFAPSVTHAPRGGLATYHGPGQIVLWPVVDLRSPLHSNFSVREYTCVLEKTTIATLWRLSRRIEGFTTENPGVWVKANEKGEERKISALGVHLRRHVTGLGVAINLWMPVAGPDDINPWARIVACGLHDRGVTSIAAHLNLSAAPNAEVVAAVWAKEFAARLGGGSSTVEDENWKSWEERLELDGPDDGYVQGQPSADIN